jgi:hypothetical protein
LNLRVFTTTAESTMADHLFSSFLFSFRWGGGTLSSEQPRKQVCRVSSTVSA